VPESAARQPRISPETSTDSTGCSLSSDVTSTTAARSRSSQPSLSAGALWGIGAIRCFRIAQVYTWSCSRDFRSSHDKSSDRGERSLVNIEHFQRSCCTQSICLTQIGLGPLVATSTSNKVAALRTVPAIVMRGSDMSGCCSASALRRVLTLWSWLTSRKIA